jgi:catechol 2,3-dioxygenase-like lactoylglutathione lyase family enzyme
VAAKDKIVSAEFFASIFGLTVTRGGYFAQVQVNKTLTLDFADGDGWGGPGHYAFHVSDAEFEAIFAREKAGGLPYDSGPEYFEDPYGHLLEVMTVPETGS